MPAGKRLLLFSPADPSASHLSEKVSSLGSVASPCASVEELRAKLQGNAYDMVLIEDSTVLRQLLNEADGEGDVLKTSMAEIERRHILRVLASTGGNKTKAARILGIDTKTLYNKLKAYGASATAYRKSTLGRSQGMG